MTDDDALRWLVVDDDAPFRTALAAALARRGHAVRAAGSMAEALALCEAWEPDRAVIDLRMPGGGGMELLRELRKRFEDIAVVVLTGYGSIPSAIEAVKSGAVNYLTKPAEPAEIESAFTDAGPAEGPELDAVPSLDRAAWEHLQRVLSECNGNISEAARRMGMHRRTLQRKLQKLPPRR